jgi:tetratricopeptide (TPR) repeat protein
MQEALAQTDIIIEADDRHLAEAWFNRGVALESLGETTAAYNAYSRALDERPGWRLAEIELERFTVRSGS